MKHELLRMEGISFGEHGQKTLNDFNLTLYEGEVVGVFSTHAVVKHDLVALFSGRIGAQAGRLYFGNEPSPFEEADRHRPRRVGVIHSVKTLVDDLSVAENIFVIRQGFKAEMIDQRLLHRQTRQLMTEFALSVEPKTLIRDLSAVARCSVEMVKAVALGAQIVVLQDLSSFLPDADIGELLQLVARFKRKGIGFLMVDGSVSHLSHYADRVVVIKNGRNIWTFRHGEVSDDVIKACFSQEQSAEFSSEAANLSPANPERARALAFDAVQCGALEALSFVLHRGEALCIVDLKGTGIDAIRGLLSGVRRAEAGRILVDGKPFTARSEWQALDQAIALVVENPADTMLFPDLTAIENLCLPASKKARGFWIDPDYRSSCAREYAPYFEPDALRNYPDEMSAQDRHKLVYCRLHLYKPGVVVCIKPFSTVDKNLDAISAFFIRLLLGKGIAVLILTSNASEMEVPCRKIVINQKNVPPHPKNDL